MKKFIFILLTPCLLLPTLSAQASYHSDKRQEARDIRQDTRTSGRQEKHDCFIHDDKDNSDCRQDKRENRRDGRRDAFDVKW
ncbi:TPA: hypothetical protein JG914_004799 [Enterobacter hormaechei subsp. steigerwaltii]|nr:hypothetical protein [Enterobacter hormaechei subsp. steigerwaltii]